MKVFKIKEYFFIIILNVFFFVNKKFYINWFSNNYVVLGIVRYGRKSKG